MAVGTDVLLRWKWLGWVALAVAAGCALLVALGAPPRMPIVNGAALLIGLVGFALIQLAERARISASAGDLALLVASALLPITAFLGPQADGVARWLVVGGLTLQPAMIVVPLIAVGAALRPSAMRTVAVIVAAFGLSIQPDPGAAAMLLAGLAAPLLDKDRRSPGALIEIVAAAIGLAVALARNIPLPPVPFVEHIIADALRSGLLPSLLAIAAAVLMMIPALARPVRAPQLAFLGIWVAALAMALLGPYPTPVVGFGGSGVLGYALSAGLVAFGTVTLRRR